MNSTKAFSYVCKVLTALSAAATAVFFFFDFFSIKGHYSLSGLQMVFGSTQNGAATYKSAWFATAFVLAVLTLVFSIVSIIKSKGWKYWTMGSSALLLINMIVLFSTNTKYFDYRPLQVSTSLITRQPAVAWAFIASIAAFVLAVVAMFVADYAEVLESHGAKLPILKRMKNFFKDYKSEITKIVWPSRKTVVKNVIVVLIMCLLVGAFIWVLDWALAQLLSLILGI